MVEKNAVEKRQSKLSYKFVSQKKKDIPLWVKKYIIAIFLCNPLAIAQNRRYNTYEKNEKIMIASSMNSLNETKFLLGHDIPLGLLAAPNDSL